ncbi:hypothetical protein EVAR_84274_1 [Eumeta japonica]|uniref:Uncharacterized protein n=1 Tax=Eumeta variegata TaxID=151549 RepID=A0A4C1WSH9_EUMVA|nr:hypothetical protein EVAR_84274_1 [Eumeta japonica]
MTAACATSPPAIDPVPSQKAGDALVTLLELVCDILPDGAKFNCNNCQISFSRLLSLHYSRQLHCPKYLGENRKTAYRRLTKNPANFRSAFIVCKSESEGPPELWGPGALPRLAPR